MLGMVEGSRTNPEHWGNKKIELEIDHLKRPETRFNKFANWILNSNNDFFYNSICYVWVTIKTESEKLFDFNSCDKRATNHHSFNISGKEIITPSVNTVGKVKEWW